MRMSTMDSLGNNFTILFLFSANLGPCLKGWLHQGLKQRHAVAKSIYFNGIATIMGGKVTSACIFHIEFNFGKIGSTDLCKMEEVN